jgi:nitroreductase
MDTLKCIKERRDIRDFRPDPIPENALREILESAIQAPSAGNVQDWHFILVKSPRTKKLLAGAALKQGFVAEAPLVIAVCSDLDRVSSAYGERGKSLYSIQNTSAAIENLLLAAWERGLGTCWVGAFNEQRIREILVLPGNVRPLALIPLGYPAKIPKKPGRRRLEQVLHQERY